MRCTTDAGVKKKLHKQHVSYKVAGVLSSNPDGKFFYTVSFSHQSTPIYIITTI